MQAEFLNHPELISHPEFIIHLEIDHLEEQAILPERVSFSEFFPQDEMANGQETPPEKRRRPLWLFWHTLARIIVVLCSLILFAVMLLRYPVHVTFRLQSVQPHSAALNLHLTLLQDPSSDILYQVTDYNEGLLVASSLLLEGDNSIFLQNLTPDTVYQISILRDGARIRSFFFNTLPFQELPPDELPAQPQDTARTDVEPEQDAPAEVPEENTPADELAPENMPPQENEATPVPRPTPPVIIIIPPADPADPAATGPVNPLAIDGVLGGDASAWSIVVNLRNTDTGEQWMPTEQDEGVVMIDWQIRDDLGSIVANGTSSYEEMIHQLGISLPGSIASGNYAVDIQVNFVNTDDVTTQLDSLVGGYAMDDFIQSLPANLPENVTITQTDTADALGLIYNYSWEKADTDEGYMNGGYWFVLDVTTDLIIETDSIDNSLLGQEILVTVPDDITTVGIYFCPQYENQGDLYSVDDAAVYKEIILTDTGETIRLYLLQPDSEEIPEASAVDAEESISEEITVSPEEITSQDTNADADDVLSEEIAAPAEEGSSEETEAPAKESASEETEVPEEESGSEDIDAPTEESTSDATEAPTEESASDATEAPTEDSASEETTVPAGESIDPNSTVIE